MMIFLIAVIALAASLFGIAALSYIIWLAEKIEERSKKRRKKDDKHITGEDL